VFVIEKFSVRSDLMRHLSEEDYVAA
jgi:hypothetical protein